MFPIGEMIEFNDFMLIKNIKIEKYNVNEEKKKRNISYEM